MWLTNWVQPAGHVRVEAGYTAPAKRHLPVVPDG
jgi:hypothetical protein